MSRDKREGGLDRLQVFHPVQYDRRVARSDINKASINLTIVIGQRVRLIASQRGGKLLFIARSRVIGHVESLIDGRNECDGIINFGFARDSARS